LDSVGGIRRPGKVKDGVVDPDRSVREKNVKKILKKYPIVDVDDARVAADSDVG